MSKSAKCRRRIHSRQLPGGRVVAIAEEVAHDAAKTPSACAVTCVRELCQRYCTTLDRLLYFERMDEGELIRVEAWAVEGIWRVMWRWPTPAELVACRGFDGQADQQHEHVEGIAP
jgi:hypothetical protein